TSHNNLQVEVAHSPTDNSTPSRIPKLRFAQLGISVQKSMSCIDETEAAALAMFRETIIEIQS
ncbi:hypothetical protein, partial [Corynebacterium afermentans]|uniref:hypothetical protein n=1 Tax=Corynebacterium afermentans TaxID=38286 RepID=UPI0025722255